MGGGREELAGAGWPGAPEVGNKGPQVSRLPGARVYVWTRTQASSWTIILGKRVRRSAPTAPYPRLELRPRPAGGEASAARAVERRGRAYAGLRPLSPAPSAASVAPAEAPLSGRALSRASCSFWGWVGPFDFWGQRLQDPSGSDDPGRPVTLRGCRAAGLQVALVRCHLLEPQCFRLLFSQNFPSQGHEPASAPDPGGPLAHRSWKS